MKKTELCLLSHDFIAAEEHVMERSQRSLHPAPCYLRQPHHTIPLVIWTSFIIKLVRLLLATHSSCWRLFLSFPPLLAANLLPAFKQNLLNRIHFGLLSECTILIQLGEEAEGSGAPLHHFFLVVVVPQIHENISQVQEAHCMGERQGSASDSHLSFSLCTACRQCHCSYWAARYFIPAFSSRVTFS